MRTIVAVFREISEAEQAVQSLVDCGFSRDNISIVAHGPNCAPALGPVPAVTSEGSLGTSAAVGGLGGFAIGLVTLAIPGVGPILAGGPIAAELVAGGIGSVAGGVITWFKQMGVPDNDAGSLCEALRRGGIILTVESPEERAADAQEIVGAHRLIDMDEATLDWHRQGLKRSDPSRRAAGETDPPLGLPFDPESLKPSVRRERAARRKVRSYVRVT